MATFYGNQRLLDSGTMTARGLKKSFPAVAVLHNFSLRYAREQVTQPN
jgi:hypothetical protein